MLATLILKFLVFSQGNCNFETPSFKNKDVFLDTLQNPSLPNLMLICSEKLIYYFLITKLMD